MGDIADRMLEGNMCQYCGEILNGKGYPTICFACQIENNVNEFGEPRKEKVKCPKCNRRVSPEGLKQHMEAKHA